MDSSQHSGFLENTEQKAWPTKTFSLVSGVIILLLLSIWLLLPWEWSPIDDTTTTMNSPRLKSKEGDLIIGAGGRSAVATLVERKSRLTLLIKVSNRTTREVVACVRRRLRATGAVVESITWDQGTELADHTELARCAGAPVFFADAHSPWQRGSNENSNGVTRRWHPKGTDLDVHPAKLRTTQQRLNNRPMPVLSGATPQEAYAAEINMQ